MKTLRIYIRTLIVLIFASASGGALFAKDPAPEPLVELPIEIVDNRVQLTLPVEHYKLKFALDTGASRTVIFQSNKYSFDDLPSVSTAKVAFPALDEFVKGTKLAPIEIQLGTETFNPKHPILIQQRPPIGERLSFNFDAILGQDFFKQYVVEIDPKADAIRLYKPGTDLKRYYRKSLRLYMKDNAPHLRFRTQLPWEDRPSMKELLLDTGYPGAMVIWNRRQFIDAAGTSKIDDYLSENKGIVTLSTFRIGGLRFQDVPLFAAPKVPVQAQERDGLIGSNILIQFKHVIDFHARRLLLQSGRLHRHPIDGTFYTPNNENYVVKDYTPIYTVPTTIITAG
ncbi:MAG: hypothetical protein AB3N28_09425 [Kordiimonas sp.]